MQISARNLPKGRIKQVMPGAVNTEVAIELPGGAELVSVITKSSAERLHLSQGPKV
jgi:molybdopterin-binding protein